MQTSWERGERGGERGKLGERGEQFGVCWVSGGSGEERGEGGAVLVCWVSSLGMLGERETERERMDWVCVSSLGMLGEKEWEGEWKDREG
jgi:hypothetical protein